jgi:hypothetical protein
MIIQPDGEAERDATLSPHEKRLLIAICAEVAAK